MLPTFPIIYIGIYIYIYIVYVYIYIHKLSYFDNNKIKMTSKAEKTQEENLGKERDEKGISEKRQEKVGREQSWS